jgi:photosystem II stability/assembly factor-like uncharacterized protein
MKMSATTIVPFLLLADAQGWVVVPCNTTKSLYASEEVGRLVVGAGGAILRDNTVFVAKQSADTPSYRVNYQPQVSGTTRDLFSVHCINTCWAVGDSGTTLHQVGGGWSMVPSGTTKALRSVYFYFESDSGYAVGDGGTILKKTGAAWNNISSGVTQNLHWVGFQYNYLSGTNPNRYDTGFSVGAGGVILKSTNRGSTWVQQTSGTTQTLYSMHFWDNSAVGFVVGAGGTILKTTNRGGTWTPISSGTTNNLRSIFFPDPQYTSTQSGIIVGEGGTMLTSTNGGDTWTSVSSGTTKDLYSVILGGSSSGIALGRDGTILAANPVVSIHSVLGITKEGVSDNRLFDLRGRQVERVPEGVKVPWAPVVSPRD